jgi:hypothetical protein
MKPLNKHCWATPKCGTNLMRNVWKDVTVDKDYTFLLARNPYNRLASFYAEKIIILCIDQLSQDKYKVDPKNHSERNRVCCTQASDFFRLTKNIKDMTFKDMCLMMTKEHVDRGDLHIRKQTDFVKSTWEQSWWEVGTLPPKDYFDDILFMEDLPECFDIPAKKMGVNVDTSKENLRKLGGENRTPRSDELNSLEEPWNIPASQWWDYGAMPSDYSVLYDDELRDIVYNLYIDDFEYFGLSK